MKIIAAFAVGLTITGLLSAAPAQAQATRTFVSPTGDDASVSCSLATPCRTFAAAYALTNAGGEIAVLGTAGYGPLTISKAISIVNGGGFEAGIAVPSDGTGITINAESSDAVSLRGLSIEGGGVGQTGIQFNSGASLTVENCTVRNHSSSGVAITPNTAVSIVVSNTMVSNNGGHGIIVQPSSAIISGSVEAIFNRVEVYKNSQMGIGLFASSSGGNTNIIGMVVESVSGHHSASGSAGYYASGSHTILYVNKSTSFHDRVGVLADNSAAITVEQSHLGGDGNLPWQTLNGGGINSYGDNYTLNNSGTTVSPVSRN